MAYVKKIQRINQQRRLRHYTNVYVEADHYGHAKTLLETQYRGYNLYFLKEEEIPSTSTHSSDNVSSTGISSKEAIYLIIALAIFIPGKHFYDQIMDSSPKNQVPAPIARATLSSDTDPSGQEPAADYAPPEDSELQTHKYAASAPQEQPESAPTPTIAEPASISSNKPLIKFKVLVRDGNGNDISTTLSAKSVDDAYRILKDFRGNPEVISIQEIEH